MPNRNPLNINKQESIPVGCAQPAFVVPGGEGLGYPRRAGYTHPPTPRKQMGPGIRRGFGTRDILPPTSGQRHLLKHYLPTTSLAVGNYPCDYYRPQRRCGKVMFLHLSVILFTKGVSGHLPAQADTSPPGRHPPGRHTPRADTPPGQTPPPARLLQWTIRIILECILVASNVPIDYIQG